MEFRVEELCDYASGRQNQEDTLEEREPRTQERISEDKAAKKKGRAAEENAHSGGTSKELVFARAEWGPRCPHILLVF